MSDNHSFDTKIAAKYGIVEAILLGNFCHWIEKNIANKKHFHDGYCWTYSTVAALNRIYFYVSKSAISRAIKHLETEGLLLKGNYNKSAYDRTCWYALTEDAYKLLGREELYDEIKNAFFNMENGFAEEENGFDDMSKPIPYIITDIKTDFNAREKNQNEKCRNEKSEEQPEPEPDNFDVADAYEKIVAIYPRKTTKGAGFETWKKMMINTPKHLRKKLAYNIFEGILEYLDYYKHENPSDTELTKIKEIEWWLKQDADYWIRWVEQRERNSKK